MFCEIKCVVKEGKQLTEEDYDLLYQFLGTLQNNGQILKGFRIVENQGYSLYVTLPKENSFDEQFDSTYVKNERQKVKEKFDYTLIPVGNDVGSKEYCNCENRSAIEMQTYSEDNDSVFTCCDCAKPIALYELPLNDGQEDFYEVICWQENYSSMNKIWMNCLCDRYTGNQLMNHTSSLNRQGFGIAEYLRKKLDGKVYYNLFDDLGYYGKLQKKWVKIGKKPFRICPKCGKVMRYFENGDFKRMLCDDCELSCNDITEY